MVNISSNSYINHITVNKKEKKLLKQLTRCRTRKCSKVTKEYIKENQIFENKLDKTCDTTNFDCLEKFTKKHGAKSRKLYTKFMKCSKEKCAKETKLWRKVLKPLK
jgi:hypothetical protein